MFNSWRNIFYVVLSLYIYYFNMKSKQEFNFKDRYFSDRVELRINRTQFFLRILSVVLLLWINMGLLYSCILIDFLSGSCPVSHMLNSALDIILYNWFFISFSLFFPVAVLIRKRIHDLGYSWNIIYWIFRVSIILYCILLLWGTSLFPDSIANKVGFLYSPVLFMLVSFISLTVIYLLFRKWNGVSNQYGEPR